MGVVFKSTAKLPDVTAIKSQVVNLMEIKFEQRNVVEIHLQVKANNIKTEPLKQVAIIIEPAHNKQILTDEEMARKLKPDYILPCSLLTYREDRRAAMQQIFERLRQSHLSID